MIDPAYDRPMKTPKIDWLANIQLKPCPFCGLNLKVYARQINPFARCETEDCKGSKLPMLNIDDPEDIASWNIRPENSAATAQIDQIKAHIRKYYSVLDAHQHAGVARFDAFSAIEVVLGMSWPEEKKS